MAETRTFKVTADVSVTKTVEYIVTAASFEDASEQVQEGYWDDVYDEYEDGSSVDCVNYVECHECDQDEDDCECASDSVFAELGL